ncbi:MAG TPA: SMC-Scp complex subunit ScpB [Candidatus Coprovicinus avistercoris]|uniref:SMC-Scp complex subunit ScpB n=1 Tax=Candidatus Coprovicinus avistercoris TaxID=2840754 RepID=A0A9D1L577_9ACTN|nr:SMC-Scp complex subunit ScpB [Candidatus Coprovicinus avistercoris]
MDNLETLDNDSLKPTLEALLLVANDPVAATDLARVLGVAPGEIAQALAELSAEYADANRGFQLREVAGGWRFYTHPAYHDQVESFVMSWDVRRLSQAALETLAVVAYHQPVTRESVKAVRGVNSDGVISSLVDKGLIHEVGRDKERGQAILYGTTQAFLEQFGLKSLRELPDLEQFAPDEESRQFIRERLSATRNAKPVDEMAHDIDEDKDLAGDEGDLNQEQEHAQ